jgi:hypothetical protein
MRRSLPGRDGDQETAAIDVEDHLRNPVRSILVLINMRRFPH